MFEQTIATRENCYTPVILDELMDNVDKFDDIYHQPMEDDHESAHIAFSSKPTTKIGAKRKQKGGNYAVKFWKNISRLATTVESAHSFDYRKSDMWVRDEFCQP